MIRSAITFLGRLYQLIASLALIAILTIAAWFLWHAYEEERLQNLFLKEGQLVEVAVADADYTQRSWRDMVGNTVYLHFSYQQKTYETRYVLDSAWISVGSAVRLLYHPGRDAFRQPHAEQKPDHRISRLIKWSSVNDFSGAYKLLGGFLVVATFLFFLASGILVSFTGWPFLQTIAQTVLVVVLALVAVFFTYDMVQHYRYYQRVKLSGQPMEVTILATDRDRVGKSTRRALFKQYRYNATCRYQHQERVFPITETDYETLKPNDQLRVLYHTTLDDLMSATYSLDYGQFAAPVLIWLLFLAVFWNLIYKAQRKR
ncbi:hypothetical protein [Larkinella harenae]